MSPWRQHVDVSEFLTLAAASVKKFLGSDAAGVVLVDPATLRAVNMGVTCEAADAVLEVQDRTGQGPMINAIATGKTQQVDDIRSFREEWPEVVDTCEREQILAGVQVPFFDDDGLASGVVSYGYAEPGSVDPADIAQLKVVSRLITAGLREHVNHLNARTLAEQLETALDTRVLLEQAKGHIARVFDVHPDRAYAGMLRYSRFHREPLRDVAEKVLAASTEEMKVWRNVFAAQLARKGQRL